MNQTTLYIQEGQCDYTEEAPSASGGGKEGPGKRQTVSPSPRKRGNQQNSFLTSHSPTPTLNPFIPKEYLTSLHP